MLIREEQFKALRQHARNDFVDRTAAHLKMGFSGHPVAQDDSVLRAFILKEIETAASYELTSEYDVRRFIELMMEYGPDFHQAAWASGILNNERLTPSARLDQVENYTVFVLRSE